jgi:hypothetical protein
VEGRLRARRRRRHRIIVGGIDDRGVVARLRERLQRVLDRRRADDGGRGVQVNVQDQCVPVLLVSWAVREPACVAVTTGVGGVAGATPGNARAAAKPTEAVHAASRRCRTRAPDRRDRCHANRLLLTCVGPSGDNNAGASSQLARVVESVDNLLTRSRRASNTTTTSTWPTSPTRPRPLVAEEVRRLLDRLAGEVDVERAMEIIAAAAEPLRAPIGARHSKLLLAELSRQRDSR